MANLSIRQPCPHAKLVLRAVRFPVRSTSPPDVDLLVLLGFAGESFRKAAEIKSAVPAQFAIDLLVRTPATLRRRLRQNDFFLKEIVEKGIVLYDSADAGMGRKGRRRLQRRALALAGVNEFGQQADGKRRDFHDPHRAGAGSRRIGFAALNRLEADYRQTRTCRGRSSRIAERQTRKHPAVGSGSVTPAP